MQAIMCPRCGKMNDGSLDFCIYCGTYFDDYNEENDGNLLFIKTIGKNGKPGKQAVRLNEMPDHLSKKPQSHTIAILLGYLFAILGGLIGFVFAIYLITRKDKVARRHGLIQLIILLAEYALVAVLFMNGQIDLNAIVNPLNMTRMNNLSQLYNQSQMNITSGSNISSLFGF